jgi:prepilin-type N-terminal cleavage/methylation domain-containing protein
MKQQRGFTILELLIVVIVGGILIGSTVSVYQKFMKIHRRQQGVIALERELSSIQLSFSQALTTLPGRELGVYSGSEYTVPELPANGTLIEGSKTTDLKLGLVTPYKINNNDAVMIIYGRHDVPRMELAQTSDQITQFGRTYGRAYVAIPETAEAIQEITTKVQAGDLVLLVGTPPYSEGTGDISPPSESRIVSLIGQPEVEEAGTPHRALLRFYFDYCQTKPICVEQFPQLKNTSYLTTFGIGGILAPINIATFYIVNENGYSRVMRNDGGTVVPIDGNDLSQGYKLIRGKDSLVGEADSLKISYIMEDGSEKATPQKPMDIDLNGIKAVRVEVKKSAKLPFNETATRELKISFPIAAKGLE